MSRIARKVIDKRLLKLIGKYLRAGVMIEGVLHATTEGTPQGGQAVRFLHCLPTSCWMTWTRSWNIAVCRSCVMRMTS
jgi:hypothetical protein